MTSRPTGGGAPDVPRSSYPPGFDTDRRSVAVVRRDFTIQEVTGGFLKDLGADPDDVAGCGLADLWALGPGTRAAIEARVDDEPLVSLHLPPAPTRPGTPPATLKFAPLPGPDGERVGFSLSVITDVVERHQRDRAQRASGLELIFEQLDSGTTFIGIDGAVVRANAAMARLLGTTPAELIGVPALELAHPDDRPAVVAAGVRVLAGETQGALQEVRLQRADGSYVWVQSSVTCVRDDGGHLLQFVSQYVDISDRKRAEAERDRALESLVESEAKFKFLVEGASVPLLEIDRDLRISLANAALARLIGREPRGVPIADLIHPDDLQAGAEQVAAAGVSEWVADIRIRHAEGTLRLVRAHTRVHMSAEGEIESVTATWQDVTEVRHEAEDLRRQAATDSLTGLANRKALQAELDAAVDHGTAPLGVLFVDLDDFKRVNDRWGHAAGDELLCLVAARLRSCVRAGDVVARLGGDEFVVLVRLEDAEGRTGQVGSRVVEALSEPYELSYGRAVVGASVGSALGPAHSDPAELLRRADMAAYRAKRAGKGRLVAADR